MYRLFANFRASVVIITYNQTTYLYTFSWRPRRLPPWRWARRRSRRGGGADVATTLVENLVGVRKRSKLNFVQPS